MILFGETTGLYGHVQQNRKRLVLLFFGYMLAAQLAGYCLLVVPTIFLDLRNSIVVAPIAFVAKWAPWIGLVSALYFLFRYVTFSTSVGARIASTMGASASRRVERIIRELSILNGMSVPAIRELESPALNAFAAGVSEKDATIIVTTGLLRALDDEELRAVLAHEMAHIIHGDTRVMVAAAVSIEAIETFQRWAPWRDGLGWGAGVAMFVFIPLGLFALLIATLNQLANALVRTTRLIVASSRETIADAEAYRMTKNASALVSALSKIEGRSGIGEFPRAIEAMMIDGPSTGGDATHPEMSERIAVLCRLASVEPPNRRWRWSRSPRFVKTTASGAASSVVPPVGRPRSSQASDEVASFGRRCDRRRTTQPQAGGVATQQGPTDYQIEEPANALSAVGSAYSRVRSDKPQFVKRSKSFRIATYCAFGFVVFAVLSRIWSPYQAGIELLWGTRTATLGSPRTVNFARPSNYKIPASMQQRSVGSKSKRLSSPTTMNTPRYKRVRTWKER